MPGEGGPAAWWGVLEPVVSVVMLTLLVVVFLVWAYWSSLAFLFGARLCWALREAWTRAGVVA